MAFWFNRNDLYFPFGFIVTSAFLLTIHTLFLWGAGLWLILKKRKTEAGTWFLSGIIVLLIGYSLCSGGADSSFPPSTTPPGPQPVQNFQE
jgi:hypothetical protein